MRSKAVALGHPIHAMLIPFPIAFLAGAALFDGAGWLFDLPSLWTTGAHLNLAGVAAALAAAVPGLIDYWYTVPPDSSGKTRATRHMVVMLITVGLFAVAWWIRGPVTSPPSLAVLGLEAIGLGCLTSGAYMGGTLVTRNMIGIDHRYAQAGRWRETTFDSSHRQPLNVAKRDELKVDQMKLLRIGGTRIVLARTERGYVAFDDRCTHRGGSLAGGVMACGRVQCLWHGSQFDVLTGHVAAGPAARPISVYQLREDGDDVLLELTGPR